MPKSFSAAVIFDVDGPLLDLTSPEEDAFFVPFQEIYGIDDLSRDWDSYKFRNDVEIYREILSGKLGRSSHECELEPLAKRYFEALEQAYTDGTANVVEIPGARQLLERIDRRGDIALGTATANFRRAAEIRLERTGMWSYLKKFPGAAEGGGAKRDILARVITKLDLPRDRIVFLGDNLNDLDAGQANRVHFIGFHTAVEKRQRLIDAGATVTSGDHDTSWKLICEMLDLA